MLEQPEKTSRGKFQGTLQETPVMCAADAFEYSRKLIEIFSRSVDGNYSDHEDYAIHKNGRPWDAVPENWMSTPMVPLCIGSIFGKAIAQATEQEKPSVIQIGHDICANFEKLVKMAEEVRGQTTSLSVVAGNAEHQLPQIRALLG